jgi:membrane-associated phospholipid phosphatase
MTQTLARSISLAFSPPIVVVPVGAVVSLRHARAPSEALLWTLVILLFASVGPVAVVLAAMRMGWVEDIYVSRREQRPRPFALGAISVLAGAVVLGAVGAEATVVALGWTLAGGLVVATLLTVLWKVSFHAAVAAGAVAVLLVDVGQIALLGLPVVALVGWARVVRRAHTPEQVMVGAIMGALISALIFVLAR